MIFLSIILFSFHTQELLNVLTIHVRTMVCVDRMQTLAQTIPVSVRDAIQDPTVWNVSSTMYCVRDMICLT